MIILITWHLTFLSKVTTQRSLRDPFVIVQFASVSFNLKSLTSSVRKHMTGSGTEQLAGHVDDNGVSAQFEDVRYHGSEDTPATVDRYIMACIDEIFAMATDPDSNFKTALDDITGSEPWVTRHIEIYEQMHNVQFNRDDFVVKMKKRLTP
jgi:hypothetical protein